MSLLTGPFTVEQNDKACDCKKLSRKKLAFLVPPSTRRLRPTRRYCAFLRYYSTVLSIEHEHRTLQLNCWGNF